MHSAELSLEALEHLWANYWVLGQQVDLHRMPTDKALLLVQQPETRRSLEIAAWLATQGFFISAWSLWEYHSRSLCDGMPTQVSDKGKSHVQWVADTFTANGKIFAEHAWFTGGNALRNLIAHHATRVVGPGAQRWWEKAQPVFPELRINPQQYIMINSDQASTLMWKVGEFIRDPGRIAH
jgi:hypothetical protein